MKRFMAYSLVVVGIFVSRGFVYAEHDKSCKNVHGKVTVIAEDGITVGDKMYKVGKTTRISKDDKAVKLENISVGDMVCLDPRGQDDIGGGEVASVAVLSINDPVPAFRETEYVRETQTVGRVSHDKNCNHIHGKVTSIDDSTIVVEGKSYPCSAATLITKDGRTTKIETIKAGDFVCVDKPNEKVASVVVLSPSDAAPFQSREVIREKIREEK
jgi:hypothetical protein